MSTSPDDLSLSVPFDATCPICHTAFVGHRWVIVDSDRRPELCAYAFDGSLHLSFCPACIGPGVALRGTYVVARRVDEKLQFLNFIPFGTEDVPGEVSATNSTLRERAAAAGIKADAIEPMGSRLFRSEDQVDEMISDTWPGLKRVDPTLIPDAVGALLSAATDDDRAEVLLSFPDLTRPHVDRFLEMLADPSQGERAAPAVAARTFIATVSKTGLPAAALIDLGHHYQDQNNEPAAIALFQRALALSTDLTQTALIARTLGNCYYATEQYKNARTSFETAAKLYEHMADTESHLSMMLSVGNALDGLDLVDEAAAQYGKTATLAAASGYLQLQAVAAHELGNLFGGRDRFNEARDAHADALRMAWEAQDAELVENIAGRLADDLRALGESGAADAEALAVEATRAGHKRAFALARAGFSAAKLLVDAEQAPLLLADIWDTEGRLHHRLSDFDAAIDASHKAIALAVREKDVARQAAYHLNLGSSYLDWGRPTEGLGAANAAFTLAKQSNSSAVLVKALGNLGTAKLRLGDFSGAEADLRRQYELAGEMNDEPQTAQAANTLGAFYLALGGSNSRAAELLQEARRLAQAHSLAGVELSCLINLAIVEGRRTHTDRTAEEAMYREAIALSIDLDRADAHVDAAINLARLLTETGRIEEAATVLAPIEEVIGALNDADRSAGLNMLQAEIALKRGDLEGAREAYLTAGSQFQESSPERSAQCFVEATQIAYDEYMTQKAAGKGASDPAEEATYFRALFEGLVLPISTFRRVSQKLDDHRLWQLMQRQEKGFRLYAELALKFSTPATGLEAFESGRGRAMRLSMSRRRAGHRTSAFDVMQTLREAALRAVTSVGGDGGKFAQLSPEAFAALGRSVQRKEPEVPILDEASFVAIAKSLDAPLVEFAFGARGELHVWVVIGDAIQSKTLELTAVGGADGLRDAVTRLRATSGVTRDLGAGPAAAPVDATPLLRQLFDVLISPIEALLPGQEGAPVCIVPDGPLFDVPFAALQGADGRAVLDRWSVFAAPALHFFAVAPEQPGTGVIVAGDPTASMAAEQEWGPIIPLPFAREEAEEVATLHGTTALVDAGASKAQVEGRLGQVELAHLAAHAILSPTYPFDSAIVLAASGDDDGLVRIRDIDSKMLQARLVVLSCCSTGGGVVTGDGVLSLCRSLLAAGAHSVLASLWAVADESTRFTMTDFHRRVAADPFAGMLATVFRQSQLATRDKYPHHSQWAPFVLWGWPHWVQGKTWTAPVLGKSIGASK